MSRSFEKGFEIIIIIIIFIIIRGKSNPTRKGMILTRLGKRELTGRWINRELKKITVTLK